MIFNISSGTRLNFRVKAYASDAALLADTPGENTIGIITETPIPGFTFAARNPYIGYKDVDLLSGVTLGDGYISSSGGITGQTAANPELYTVDYIPVEYGKSYEYRYTVSASKNMWLAIAEYTGSYTFSTRLVPVNSVAGTVQTGTYTPSSENVTAVRLTWRTFPGTTCTVELIEKDVPYTLDGTEEGMVWIKTGVSSAVEFNALRRNALQVYPIYAQQYVSGEWVYVTAKSFLGGAWFDLWAGELYENGTFYQDHIETVSPDGASITLESDSVIMKTKASATNELYIGFGPYDLSGYRSLVFTGEVLSLTSDSQNIYFCGFIATSADAKRADAVSKVETNTQPSEGIKEFTLDLSDQSGQEYYVFVGINTAGESWSKSRTAHIYSAKLVR